VIVCKPSQQQTALQRFQDKNIILKPVKDFKLLIIDRFKAVSGEICFGGILLNPSSALACRVAERTPSVMFLTKRLRHEELPDHNPQLLTLVHGVDRKGRPVIRAYTGNARHPIYQEYQGVINKHYQQAARLAEFSRNVESPYSVNNSTSDHYSKSGSPSTPRTRTTTRWTPSLSGASSPAIIPELKGMRAMVSRLRCSLAIHAGLGSSSGDLNFLPVIPVRYRKPPTTECPKKGRPKAKPATNKLDLEIDSRKTCQSTPQAEAIPHSTERCKGFANCKGACSKVKKTKKRKKQKIRIRRN